MKDKELESKIPKGVYCYDEKGICPYWSRNNNYPEQENGYCSYLGKGDWELNESGSTIIYHKDYPNATQQELNEMFPNMPGFSLLWDQCKECGVNEDWEDVEEQLNKFTSNENGE